jgi:hypothetical protein
MRNAKRLAVLSLVNIFAICGAAYAQALAESQPPKLTRLQVGVALDSTTMPGEHTRNSIGPSVVWRWRGRFSRHDDRWAFAYRLSSFDSQVSSPIGPRSLPVADMKVRTLMVGVEYKMPRGRWNWGAGFSAGWAVNSVDTPDAYRDAAGARTGVDDLWVDVHNSLVWGPRLKGWYDINRRVSLLVESSYLVTRPSLDVRVGGVSSTHRLKADAFVVKAGIVYGIF